MVASAFRPGCWKDSTETSARTAEAFCAAQATPYIAGGKMVNFDEPCDYFTVGKAKASTLSLSVLVSIEMFNALNALSEVSNGHSSIHL